MKVLYIGCYRDGTGWAKAAIDYILSMDSVGIDVVCRPLKLNQTQAEIPERIIQLENKPSSGCDVCIQHTLPHYMDYNGKFKKNIALYATETDSFGSSTWPRHINTMDEAWVINNQMVEASKKSGIKIPIKVIPHASDVEKFNQDHPHMEIPQANNDFIFYFLGDMTRRKNLVALMKAFHLEFEYNEPVSLLIKSNKYGLTPEECVQKLKEMSQAVKENLKLYPDEQLYKEELFVTDYLSDNQIIQLHRACDCFVMPSYGEAWCIPAFDAMGFGKTPICTDIGGMSDFLSDGAGLLVSSTQEPVFGMTDTFQDICSSREDWAQINVRDLQKKMRSVYELQQHDEPEYKKLQQRGIDKAQEYSYKKIGEIIKRELSNVS